MRIFTRVVWEWQGDELVQTEADSHEYEGPVDLAKAKGAKNYKNLERLYGIQADQAQFLGETFKGTVAPAYKSWLGEAQGYGSQANQELAAERAGKSASGAISQQQQALEQNLASMGINPADQRYAQGMREMGIQGAAQQAGAETTARESIRDKGFARTQDAIALGMGTPTQAAQAANSAANAATSSMTAQNQAAQMQSQAASNIAQAGMNVADKWNQNSGGHADGGMVGSGRREILRLAQGGYVQRLARGGFAGGTTPASQGGGFMGTPQVAAPPPTGGPAPSTAGQAASLAATPLGMKGIQQGGGMAIEAGGKAAGSPGVEAFGRGLQLSPADARAGQVGYEESAKVAQELVDNAMGGTSMQTPAVESAIQAATPVVEGAELGAGTAGTVGSVAAPVAAETAGAIGAGAAGTAGAAGAAGASAAGLGAAAALGTAVPIIGGGLALYGIGDAAGWWADGGEVKQGGGGGPSASARFGKFGLDFNSNQGEDKRGFWEKFSPGYALGDKVGLWADGGGVEPGSQGQTGAVDGPGGPKDDEILAALSDGEFVMPVGAVRYFGIDRLEKMRQKGLEHEKQMGIG